MGRRSVSANFRATSYRRIYPVEVFDIRIL